MRATVNGKEVFLDADELPAFSLSINEVTDPSVIRGARSPTIRVVSDNGAKRAFGTEFMGQLRSGQRPELRIGNGGVDDFRAEVVVTRQDRNAIECVAVGGNATWFEYAKKTKLRDIDLGVTAPLDPDVQRATWYDVDSTVLFPLVDMGALEGRDASYDVPLLGLRPGLRTHRVIEEAMKAIGYKVRAVGELANDWKKFVLFAPSETIRSEIVDPSPSATSVRPLDEGPEAACTTTPRSSTPGWYECQATSDPSSLFNGAAIASAQRYLVPFDTKISVTIRDLVIENIPAELDGTRLHFVLWDKTGGYPIAEVTTDPLMAGDDYTFSADFPLAQVEEGTEINVGINNETEDDVVVIIQDLDIGDPSSEGTARITFKPTTQAYSEGAPLVIQTASPDFTVIELISGLMKQWCLTVTTSEYDHTISFYYDHDYFRIATGRAQERDWKSRIDISTAPARVRANLPAQLNFRFKEDTQDRELVKRNKVTAPEDYGSAVVELGGLEANKDVSVPWAATGMVRTLSGLLIPAMRKVGGEYQVDSYDFQPRLLVMDGLTPGSWKHEGSMLTEYPKCYFVHPDPESTSVAFGNQSVYFIAPPGTVETRWAKRLQRMRDSDLLEASLFLKDHELSDFHHGIPTLVDDGSGPAWYYVQEIKEHRFGMGRPTKCVLVQIPGKEVVAMEANNGSDVPPIVPGPVDPPIEALVGWDGNDGPDEWDGNDGPDEFDAN